MLKNYCHRLHKSKAKNSKCAEYLSTQMVLSVNFRLNLKEMALGELEKAHLYINMTSKFRKSKCESIQNKF